jgi:hypothetical protein
MPVILRNTAIGRRATLISREDLDEMLDNGTAKHCAPYGELYEEVTKEEIAQGYMTRNLEALPVVGSEPKKRGRPPKARVEAPVVEVAPVVNDDAEEEIE